MRRTILSVLGLMLLLAVPGFSQEKQEQSVAEAARKAREKKKDAPKAKKVFTNDTIPKEGGGVSVVGEAAAPAPAKEGEAAKAEQAAEGEEGKEPVKDEAYWRGRFAQLRTKLSQAQKELDILQRELRLNEVQYYSDPNQALRQQLTREEINEQRKKIDEKQAEVQQIQQEISNLEDELRQAGGNPGWARP